MTDPIIDMIRKRALREIEIQEACRTYPSMEMGAAYKKWKIARGESPEMLLTATLNRTGAALRHAREQLFSRPCTRDGCLGIQRLEGVCSGCIEGQAGYRSKWTCPVCMHRDLSKEDLNPWLIKLSLA